MVRSGLKKLMIYLAMVASFSIILSGCGKQFWDYETGWFTDKPYFYIGNDNTRNVITIDGKKKQVNAAWNPSGAEIYFYDPAKPVKKNVYEANYIIIGKVKIKRGKLYLTVTKDTVSDLKGKTIVFEQKRPADLDEVLKTASE